MVRSSLLALGASAAIASIACSRAEPPKITPEGVKTVRISAAGAEIESTLDAANPNDETLTASSVETTITIGDRADLARVTMTRPLELPAKQRIRVDVPIAVTWTDPAGLAALAATNADVPYHVDGTVEFRGKTARVTAPFKVEGRMTHADLVKATTGAPAGSAAPSGSPPNP